MTVRLHGSPQEPAAWGAAGRVGFDHVQVPAALFERVCRAAIEAGVVVDDARTCLTLAGRTVSRTVSRVDTRGAAVVEVFTLGRFGLLVHGRPIAIHGKGPHKPIELLQALIALGGREVHVDALIHAVWPDDQSTDPRNLFDNTLHRLRHLLACDQAIEAHDRKLALSAEHCWVDAWAFEQLAGRALSAAADAAANTARALGLYQSTFLAREAPCAWMCSYRARLHRQFLQLVNTHSQQLEKQGLWHEAVACLERGLEIDPSAEALVLALMTGHARRGAASDVMRAYGRCRQHLALALGVAPSPEVEAIRSTVARTQASPPPSFSARL